MTDRFEVERALRSSSLSANARHIARTLLFRADAGTANVPAKFSASLAVLARDTGLAKSSVRRGLIELEDAGWLTRDRDLARAWAQKLPTGYRFHIPTRATVGLVPQSDMSDGRTSPTAGTGLGPQGTSTRATAGTGPVQSRTSPDLSLGGVLAVPLPDVSEDEREKLAQRIIEKYAPRSERAYLRKLSEADVRAELEAMRSEMSASNGHSAPATKQIVEQLRRGPPCEHGVAGGASLHPESGQPLCAMCRAGVP